MDSGCLPVIFYGTVNADGCQFLAEYCQIVVFQKRIFGFVWLNILHMSMGVFYASVFQKQFCGGLFPNAWKSGNVVRGISH